MNDHREGIQGSVEERISIRRNFMHINDNYDFAGYVVYGDTLMDKS